MAKQVVPNNVLKSLGITKEQYARMGTREVMMLVRWYYSHQDYISPNLKK